MHKFFFTLLFISINTNASSLSVNMKDLNSNKKIGTISIDQNEYGVVFTPDLSNLPSGLHGFHLHVNNSCGESKKNGKTILGGGAGGHYDPMKTGKHGFPWSNDNHLGDLPPLYVNISGHAIHPVLAPRLKIDNLSGRSLMIHTNGDNHSDHPKALGGGGARLVCGVVK